MSLWALVSFLAADVTPEPKKVGQSTPSPRSKKRFNYPVWKIAKSSDLKKKEEGWNSDDAPIRPDCFICCWSVELNRSFLEAAATTAVLPFFSSSVALAKGFKLASHDFE